VSERITQQALESYLWGAATILRGLVEAGDYKQFVFPLLFYKRLSDVWDADFTEAMEETGDRKYARAIANDRYVIPDGAHWSEVRAVAKDVGRALQEALRAIEAANLGRFDGIFGDSAWTNKERLPDATLKNLLEHFSSRSLSLASVPEDELGNGYEYLIKKFADDSGHTAQEFYTNRTVVHLMVRVLEPKPGESIYDPTCGTGGMLISALAGVKRKGGEHRTLGLFGQERNHMTASIARMNLVLHGVDDFHIERGDTLAEPKFLTRDKLRTFDIVLANPPYSIKQWNRESWSTDPWGRNFLGTPPQGRADYAFFQHILKSLDLKTGRCAILFPHGVLFRREEADMRKKVVEADLVECVLGLGPNLFYNSPMEACVVVCRTTKSKARRGRILFIDALNEIARERAQSFLREEHQDRIIAAYHAFKDEPGFAKVAMLEEVAAQEHSLSIPLYVKRATDVSAEPKSFRSAWDESPAASGPRWMLCSRC
jgi:type I restriction enzyme M protein